MTDTESNNAPQGRIQVEFELNQLPFVVPEAIGADGRLVLLAPCGLTSPRGPDGSRSAEGAGLPPTPRPDRCARTAGAVEASACSARGRSIELERRAQLLEHREMLHVQGSELETLDLRGCRDEVVAEADGGV